MRKALYYKFAANLCQQYVVSQIDSQYRQTSNSVKTFIIFLKQILVYNKHKGKKSQKGMTSVI